MTNNSGQLVKLAFSSDGSITLSEEIGNVFIENCNELYGMSILQIIMDPEHGENSQLMGAILGHGFTHFHTKEKSNYSSVAFEKQSEKVWDEDQPTLVTWSKPIIIEKLGKRKIGCFIFDIVGNFPGGILDPNFVALAGFGIVLSSTTLFVTSGRLNVENLDNLLPFVVQGLRSEKLKKLQQLYLLFVGTSDSKHGFGYCDKGLTDFLNNQSHHQTIQRLRYAFQQLQCSLLPEQNYSSFNRYLTQFFGDVIDDYLEIKNNDTGSVLTGEALIDLMKKHVEDVFDDNWKSYLPNLDKLINSRFEDSNPGIFSKARDQHLSIEMGSDDDSETEKMSEEYVDDDTINEEQLVNIGPDDTDSLTTEFSKMEIKETTSTPFSSVGTSNPRRFNERYNLNFISPPEIDESIPKQVSPNTEFEMRNMEPNVGIKPLEKGIFVDQVVIEKIHNNEPYPETSDCSLPAANKIASTDFPSELPSEAVSPQPLTKSKMSLSEVEEHEEGFNKPTSTVVIPVKDEIDYQQDSEINSERFLTELQMQTIKYLNKISPTSQTSASDIVENSKELTLALSPEMRKNKGQVSVCVDAETIFVNELIRIVVSFQSEIEKKGLFILSKAEIDKIKAKYLANSFKSEDEKGYKEALEIKLEEISDSFLEIFQSNEKIMKKMAKDIANDLKKTYIQTLTKEIQILDNFDSSKLSNIHKDLKSLAVAGLGEILKIEDNNGIIDDVKNALDESIESEFSNLVESWKKKCDEEIITLKKFMDNGLKNYECKLKDSKISTLGMLHTHHAKISKKIIQQFELEIHDIPKHRQGSFRSKLEKGINEIYVKIRQERESLDTSSSNASKFVSPAATPTKSQTTKSPKIESQTSINNKTSLALGIHFGISKLTVYAWDNSPTKVISSTENKLIYTSYDFKLKLENDQIDKNGKEIDTGNIFWQDDNYEFEYKFHGVQDAVKLDSLSLLSILFSRIKRKAESKFENVVSFAVIAIPAFLDYLFADRIKAACNLIDLECEVISETDAVAIQQMGNVGSSDSGSVPNAAAIIIVRNSSCDFAGYSIDKGQIQRNFLKCNPKSNRQKFAKKYCPEVIYNTFYGQLSDHYKEVIAAIPKQYLPNLSTVVASNVDSVPLRNEVSKSLESVGKTSQHSLGVCASKGAAFLGGFILKNESATQQWDKYHDKFVVSGKSRIIGGEFLQCPGVYSKNIPVPDTIEIKKMKNILENVMASTNEEVEMAKQEVKSFFEEGKLKVEKSDCSDFFKRKMIGEIDNALDLLSLIDADIELCVKKKVDVEKSLEKLKIS